VAYDPQTRYELQTSQPFLGKNTMQDKMVENANGSADLRLSRGAGREGSEARSNRRANVSCSARVDSPAEEWRLVAAFHQNDGSQSMTYSGHRTRLTGRSLQLSKGPAKEEMWTFRPSSAGC
jgi:hypothetical protein